MVNLDTFNALSKKMDTKFVDHRMELTRQKEKLTTLINSQQLKNNDFGHKIGISQNQLKENKEKLTELDIIKEKQIKQIRLLIDDLNTKETRDNFEDLKARFEVFSDMETID